MLGWPKLMNLDLKNKLFLSVFVLFVSIYLSVAIHEIGHTIVIYVLKVCEQPIFPSVGVLLPVGNTFCDGNDIKLATPFVRTLVYISGLSFVSFFGLLLFTVYKCGKNIRAHYITATIFYFLSITCVINGLLQLFSGYDVIALVELGYQRKYFILSGIILSIFFIYQAWDFKKLIRIIHPAIKNNSVIIWQTAFITFLILYFSGYLILVQLIKWP